MESYRATKQQGRDNAWKKVANATRERVIRDWRRKIKAG